VMPATPLGIYGSEKIWVQDALSFAKNGPPKNQPRRYALQYLERSQPISPPSTRSAAQSLNEHQSSLSGCFLDIAPLGRPPLLHVFSEDLQTMRIDMKQWQSR
jgi:hypothetical protein